MQFQVPQFIETEDKLIGPITVKQFMYLGIAAGGIFILFFLLQTAVWIGVTIVISSAALTLTLLKVNGRPMTSIVISALFHYWNPQTYIWQPDTPGLLKSEAAQQSGFSLERLMAGIALKDAWHMVQTGTRVIRERGITAAKDVEERYEILHRLSGEQQAARRIDYR